MVKGRDALPRSSLESLMLEQRKLPGFNIVGCPGCREKYIITAPVKKQTRRCRLSVGIFETNVTPFFNDISVVTVQGSLPRLSLESSAYVVKDMAKVWDHRVSRLPIKQNYWHRNISPLPPESFFCIVWQDSG